MLNSRSPPQYKKLATGGSASSVNANCNNSSSSSSSSPLLLSHYQPAYGHQSQGHSHACYHHQQQQQQQQQHHQSVHSSHHSSRTSLTPTMKRSKKHWGTRERSGMSFLIVIAFFAVFGLIILTEVFMIDERTHGGMLAMRAGGGGGASLGGRLGDSMPDYDNVKHASCVLQSYQQGLVPGNLTAYDFAPLLPSEVAKNATPRAVKSDHYQLPTVSILPWNLRMRSQKEIRTEGLFAALNDCLYRTMYRYKYLALVDLDEFIVPRYTDTLNGLISSLNQRFRNRNIGAYSFQNAFYYLQFADDALASSGVSGGNDQLNSVRASLVTQRKTRRRYKLHPQKQRSKYICKPESVVEAGNHFVWEFAPGKGSLNVPPTEAILQHYRVCEFGGNDCIKAPSVVDRNSIRYVNRLVQRVDAVYRHLRQRCDLPALPALPKPKLSQAQTERQNNEKPKLLQKMRELNEKDTKKMDTTTMSKTTTKRTVVKKNVPIATVSTLGSTTSTTTPPPPPPPANVRKKRKLIVFELNDFGDPVARVEYQ
ncbi:uncharacterized protein Dwil_GK15290 [Drosophila willistoni]|uniref:Glycosyltransferase family 92 protein n=1 Tax=Drosophila willistoni TaxID=7260 RepID=B4MWH7_DROWI|nr:uncharacterized protein Dwil_GK15290 [Drosophila willistoni]